MDGTGIKVGCFSSVPSFSLIPIVHKDWPVRFCVAAVRPLGLTAGIGGARVLLCGGDTGAAFTQARALEAVRTSVCEDPPAALTRHRPARPMYLPPKQSHAIM